MIGNTRILAARRRARRRVEHRCSRRPSVRAARLDAARRGRAGAADDAAAQHHREGGAQLSRAAAGDPAFDRRLPDRSSTATNACPAMRARAPAKSQAPMVSITHFMDRDGQFLASVSPRRFFCTRMPRAAARGEAAGRQRLRRHRHAAEPRAARRAAMSAADRTAPRPSWLARLWAFVARICGTCCAGRVRCSGSACWCSPASSPA